MNNEKTKLSFDLKKIKENENIEFKKADNNLPNSLWETYSAFCNTSGGIIILGIEEKKNGDNTIIGINDIDKMEKDIWNTANNSAKVSYNVIGNGDIYKVKIDDKNIMILDIKEAPHNKKPVYLNRKIENTYIRRGEADKKADNDEIGTLMAMATPKPLLLDNFSMKDLDRETVSKFRKIVEERYPEKNYKNLNDEDFLKEIGAIRLDRKNNIYKITDGCLLLLGKYISITDYFSKFHAEQCGWDFAPLHDPCAVLYETAPELFSYKDCHVEIDLEGEYTLGCTVSDLNGLTNKPENARVLLDIDREKMIELLVEAVNQYDKGGE